MKLKPGDKVRFIDGESHEGSPEYHPKVGTVGKVVWVYELENEALVQWPEGSTSDDDRWWCMYDMVEKVEEGEGKNTRLGYYARNPEALAALLIDMDQNSNEFGLKVCHRDCVPKHELENVDCTDEKLTACIVRWLLEPMEEGEA